MSDNPLLSVERLTIRASDASRPSDTSPARPIVDGISFEMRVRRLGLVGESGSGKSLTARALLGLLRPGLAASADRIALAGRDLRDLNAREWAAIRGAEIALVLQDPRHALNPVQPVGKQIEESLVLHRRLSRAERRERTLDIMKAVGLPDPVRLLGAYPRELSGGMGQRVMLAIALVNGPKLLIADEPTSALDARLRDHVLELMSTLAEERRMGLLLISHDLQQVSRYCEHVLVMYRGAIVDACDASALATSTHPYTRTLWACRPGARTHGSMLPVLDRSDRSWSVRS
ncbi:ABC transporter ATP-binding protein [Pararobbsia silviterrae]|uniref:ABC transporter ATP-binding protein n=1 Tax=Pararobbsia silviterrae TaxID=1792498 RepID=A0A494XNI2_9BURK|nr:ABC transporter ATP-binding protein [Pararobbsia silviterrae]RKP49669.1 ABC transporter ATP-binding protein [Pararobbsia silviterrae]